MTKPDFMPSPSICLSMIVKDEAHCIRECLESVKPYIQAWIISDTGSTDDTKAVIQEVLGEIPGEIHDHAWSDFSTNRNYALELSRKRGDYSLIIDADDRLVVSAKGAERLQALDQPAYMVAIEDAVSYQRTQIVRNDVDARYQGVLHEYLSVPASLSFLEGVSIRRGERFGARWKDPKKYEKDALILEKALEAEPWNERYVFYCAQSWRDAGENKQALDRYRQRTEMGGWIEERYIAALEAAKLSGAQEDFFKAYLIQPSRCEALVHLARSLNSQQNFRPAYVFAQEAASLEKSQQDLFREDEAYDWKRHDELALAAFYVQKPEEASELNRRLLRSFELPNDQRQRVFSNFQFTNTDSPFPSAKELFGAITEKLKFSPPSPFTPINPSVHFDGEQWRCIVRTVNCRFEDGKCLAPKGDVVYTRNYMAELSDNLQIASIREMEDRINIPRTDFPIHGFEDCRFFTWKRKLWTTATVCDFSQGSREIVLFELDESYAFVQAYPLRGEWSSLCQKNWMPVVERQDHEGQELRFIYSLDPLVCFRYSAENSIRGTSLGMGRFRGSSQVISIPQGNLLLAHEVFFRNDERFYAHRFFLLSESLKEILAESESFYFERHGIEFCAGLGYDGTKLVASYGVGFPGLPGGMEDCHASLAVFSLDRVLQALGISASSSTDPRTSTGIQP